MVEINEKIVDYTKDVFYRTKDRQNLSFKEKFYHISIIKIQRWYKKHFIRQAQLLNENIIKFDENIEYFKRW